MEITYPFIERPPGTHRYPLNEQAVRTAMFYTRLYHRILRPGLALLGPAAIDQDAALTLRFTAMTHSINSWCDKARLAA